MANRRNYSSDEDSVSTEPVYRSNSSNSDTVMCKVLNISNNKLHLYFEGYGIQVSIPKDKTYRIGDMVKVGYSGSIGTPNFKKWIVT